jgi:hypothetical protein
MNARKFKLILAGVIALIIAIFCMCLFSCNDTGITKVVKDNTAQLHKDFEHQVADYNAKIDSIGNINRELRSQAVTAKSAILKVKQENRSLKRTIDDLLTIHYTTTDTITRLQNCDSLAITLQEAEALSNKKDSIYETLTANLQQQIEMQDSVIEVQAFENDSLQIRYRNLLDQHTDLIAENTAQQKVIKRQKRSKGFLGVVAGIAAGLFAWHTLK